jgi:hypothetical protein
LLQLLLWNSQLKSVQLLKYCVISSTWRVNWLTMNSTIVIQVSNSKTKQIFIQSPS